MTVKKAYFSNRIYKNTLLDETVIAFSSTLHQFNVAKHFAYQAMLRHERQATKTLEESYFKQVKAKFQLPTDYARDAVQKAKSVRSSQKELTKQYIENVKAQIHATKKKSKTTKRELTELRKIKASLVAGKPKFHQKAIKQRDHQVIVASRKGETVYKNIYLFEHQYLEPKIKQWKARVGQLAFRLDRLEKKLYHLQNKIPGVVFGRKVLFKQQYTVRAYRRDHKAWKQAFDRARYYEMMLSGRKDAKHGNFVVKYNPTLHTLQWTTADGIERIIPNVVFPYGGDAIERAIILQQQKTAKERLKNGKSIAWSVEDHGAYYLFKCVVEDVSVPIGNYSKVDGVLGIDLNYNHVAIANINPKGQLIKAWVMDFDLEDKTTGQAAKIIEALAIRLINQAIAHNKPIVVEELDTTTSKVANPYGPSSRNRKLSLFAYRKFGSAIENRATKMGVAVFYVNPAYTSQIGKMKYMRQLGISIHESAAYVIGRRGMSFKEKLPPMLSSQLPEKMVGRHHWAQWGYWTKKVSGMKVHAFYLAGVWNITENPRGASFFLPALAISCEVCGEKDGFWEYAH